MTSGISQANRTSNNWTRKELFCRASESVCLFSPVFVLNISKPITEWLTTKVSLGATDEDLAGDDPDTEFNNYDIDNQTQNVTGTLELTPSWDGVFLLGYSYENRKSDNRNNFDATRDVSSLFANKQLKLAQDIVISAGLRYDNDSDFGEETTFRTTFAYVLANTETRFHASYGTGFKAPSFNELFFPNFGNPNLEAETSWSYDIGIEQPIFDGSLVLDVTFFQNKIDDLITFDTTTFLAANTEEAKIHGIETSLDFVVSNSLRGNINYSYTDAENESTDLQLARRPKHRANISLSASPVGAFDIYATLLLVNDRIDSDDSRMDNYERVDIAVSYKVCENLKPFFRIDNVFDQDYEEVNGFETSDFAVYGGLEVSL